MQYKMLIQYFQCCLLTNNNKFEIKKSYNNDSYVQNLHM